VDIAAAFHHDNTIALYENDGDQSFFEAWIDDDANNARSVYAIDVNARVKLNAARRRSIVERHQPASKRSGLEGRVSRKLALTPASYGLRTLIYAQVDSDSNIDLLSAAMDDDAFLVYYRYITDDGLLQFVKEPITSTATGGACGVFALDVDGNGRVDILSVSWPARIPKV